MDFIRGVLFVSVPAVAVILLLLEGGLRIGGYVPWYLDGEAYVPSANAEAVYELRPGFRGLYAGVPIAVNAIGARGGEVSLDPARQRVLLLGDSIAFGQGVNEGETLAVQLALRLPATDVVNLGVSGYNTCQEFARFKDVADATRAQAVVLVVVDNDTEPPPFAVRDGKVISPDVRVGKWGDAAAALRKSSYLYNFAWTRYQRLRAKTLTLEEYRDIVSRRFDPANPQWVRGRECLAGMVAFAASRSMRMVVIPFPVLQGVGVKPYPFQSFTHLVCHEALAAGADCVDVVPGLHGSGFPLTVSPIENHPSAAVYRAIAEPVAARLR